MTRLGRLPIPLTNNAKNILGKYGQSPANIFLSILRRKRCMGNHILASSGLDNHKFLNDFQHMLEQANCNVPELEALLSYAVSIAIRTKPTFLDYPYLGTEHLLLAVLKLVPAVLDAISASTGISSEMFNEKIQENYASLMQINLSPKVECVHMSSIIGYECVVCGNASSSSRTECGNCSGNIWLPVEKIHRKLQSSCDRNGLLY